MVRLMVCLLLLQRLRRSRGIFEAHNRRGFKTSRQTQLFGGIGKSRPKMRPDFVAANVGISGIQAENGCNDILNKQQ